MSSALIQVKDRVGFTRRSNGCLHFFVNGVDQGVAALDIPPGVYGVVDLYGAAVKVSIIDSNQSNDNESGEGATAHPPGTCAEVEYGERFAGSSTELN